MKRILLLAFVFASSIGVQAQCTADYDFGEEAFGVSPDPQLGESFVPGFMGNPYEDIIHMLVPTDAGDIDPTYAGLGAVIDSLTLVSVSVLIDGLDVDLSDIGLDIECNNNGDSSIPCSFMGGNQYCSLISGIPTQFGVFPLKINVVAYLTFFGTAQGIPYAFEDYILTIEEFTGVASIEAQALVVSQNTPNPFSNMTTINYSLANATNVNFEVMNLIGERIISENYNGTRGENKIQVAASALNAGIYLYSIQAGDKKVTYRMVVND
jgi:hypothetical protein